ncbi:MAG: CHASE2 domain-containing protein [Pirellulaceae bacterium]|nr:CHASE2 domain-containing protein [Pirellulaceae bacterium]
MELPMVVDNYFGTSYYIRQSHLKDLSVDEAVPLLKPLEKYVRQNLDAPDQNGLINFYGDAGTIRSYSLWQLFADDRVIPMGYFKDKVVLLGFASELSMRGFSDKEILEVTAPGGYMYGVEIHATIAGNLLDGSWIKRLSPQLESLVLFTILFAMILGVFYLHPLDSMILVVGMFAIWFLATYVAFVHFRYFFPGIFVSFASMVIVYDIVVTTIATALQKELKQVKEMIGLKSLATKQSPE